MALRELISRLQQQLSAPAPEPRSKEEAIRLATAGLLVEVAQADSTFKPEEEVRLVAHLKDAFHLSDAEARSLVEAAHEEREQTIDHFAFTHLVRRNTEFDQRLEIVRVMWRIVLADGQLSQHEEYLVRKLAELLGIEHRFMIEAKLEVRRELGLPSH